MTNKINLNLSQYNLVIFDCDGTLIKSNSIKSKIFRDSLSKYDDDAVQKLIEFHQLNGGISRFIKFKYFFTQILKIKNFDAELEEVLNIFSQLSMDRMKNVALISGVEKFLEKLLKLNIEIIVSSGSDKNELRDLLKRLRLSKYFNYVGGSPKSKKEIVDEYIYQNNFTNPKCIVFGDSISDFMLSKKLNCDFVFIEEDSEWVNHGNYLENDSVIKINNFSEINVS